MTVVYFSKCIFKKNTNSLVFYKIIIIIILLI